MQLAHHFINNLRQIRTKYRVNTKVRNTAWARAVIEYGIDPAGVTYDADANSLSLRALDLTLNSIDHTFVLKGFEFARSLFVNADARFTNVDGLINAVVSEIRIEVRTFEELFILHEIFVEGAYNVKLAKPAVAIDIGMNVGFSSLHLAKNPKILRVFGFEPAKVTYEHALSNFSLNPELSQKIVGLNFGLSDKDETLEFDFSEEFKGSVGIHGLSHRADIDQTRVRKISFDLKNASAEIGKIIDENPGSDFVVKVDCEGSEYKIVAVLHDSGHLSRMSLIMLEWHDHDRQSELELFLTTAGFAVLSLTPNSKGTGMMYASRI